MYKNSMDSVQGQKQENRVTVVGKAISTNGLCSS